MHVECVQRGRRGERDTFCGPRRRCHSVGGPLDVAFVCSVARQIVDRYPSSSRNDQGISCATKQSAVEVTQGSAGVMTLLRVKREGVIHDIYLPRGPLGIRMSSARVAP